MKTFKECIGELFINKTIKIKSNCFFNIDVYGKVIDYDILNNELILSIQHDNKIIQVGENHPNLVIEVIDK